MRRREYLKLARDLARDAGSLAMIDRMSAIEAVDPEDFELLLSPWFESGRGLIADGLEDTASVSRLSRLSVGFIQGDALAAGGPRLDYHFGLPAT